VIDVAKELVTDRPLSVDDESGRQPQQAIVVSEGPARVENARVPPIELPGKSSGRSNIITLIDAQEAHALWPVMI
jgi:hypothetical protein